MVARNDDGGSVNSILSLLLSCQIIRNVWFVPVLNVALHRHRHGRVCRADMIIEGVLNTAAVTLIH